MLHAATIPHMARIGLGGRLRTARKLREMTQAQLARLSGVKQAAISQVETGATQALRGTTLIAIAQSLEVRPQWLETGTEPMEAVDTPLPIEAIKFAREWLKLTPQARTDVAKLVSTMVKTSAADQTAVSNEKVEAAYGQPGQRNRKVRTER